jgi:hypothetical protein
MLLLILVIALSLFFDTESQLGRIIYNNAVTPALLFIVFFAALAGVMKILVDLALPNRMQPNEINSWERTRAKGKVSFILNTLLIGGVPIVLGLAIQFAFMEQSGDGIRNFVVVAIVLIGGIAAITAARWNYQESLYQRAKENSTPSVQNQSMVDQSRNLEGSYKTLDQ